MCRIKELRCFLHRKSTSTLISRSALLSLTSSLRPRPSEERSWPRRIGMELLFTVSRAFVNWLATLSLLGAEPARITVSLDYGIDRLRCCTITKSIDHGISRLRYRSIICRQYAYCDEIAVSTAIIPEKVIKESMKLRVTVELAGKYTRLR